ncbi:hypothetical protein [Streptomyces sp. NPDC060366]|uniref:hypothetical protein n=1 Tax=Streptomyces sp. NPDC060366 TaxID=3347105 RepID=UPI00365A9E97
MASRVPALRRSLAPLVLFADSERERSGIAAQANASRCSRLRRFPPSEDEAV